MIGTTRARIYPCLLYTYIAALLLAIAWPAAAWAQPPTNPPSPDTTPPTVPTPPPGPPATSTPRPTATPAPTSPPDSNGDTSRPPTTPTPTTGGSGGKTLTLDETLAEYELIKALAPNRIIFHPATPIQLCKVEDGLQIYFISRKGKTRLGPWVPSFAELARKYPDGPEASIYRGYNPLSGKRVKIDYLPSVKRIRVDTFYSDKDNDKNKQYIFHFGPEHDITYDAW